MFSEHCCLMGMQLRPGMSFSPLLYTCISIRSSYFYILSPDPCPVSAQLTPIGNSVSHESCGYCLQCGFISFTNPHFLQLTVACFVHFVLPFSIMHFAAPASPVFCVFFFATLHRLHLSTGTFPHFIMHFV
jgi:hypothetical protein